MKHDLMLCKTVYQLIVAIQIKLTILDNQLVDIIISDELPNYIEVCSKLEQTKIFDNVICATTKLSKVSNGGLYNIPSLRNFELKKNINKFELIKLKERYSNFYFANLGGVSIQIARFLLTYNPKINFYMFEDGVSSYSKIYGDEINNHSINKSKGLKSLLIDKYIPDILELLKGYYVFAPEIMVWKPLFCVKKIPQINKEDNRFKSTLDVLYNMDLLKDSYSETVIFFEESYVADGIKVDDITIVEKLKQQYGEKEVFIKTHPRNSINRFESLGCKTNRDKSIPWEAIAINIDLSNKVLVSMTSTAVVSSFLLLNSSAKMILAYDKLKISNNNKRVLNSIEVIERIKTIYPDAFLDL